MYSRLVRCCEHQNVGFVNKSTKVYVNVLVVCKLVFLSKNNGKVCS